MAEHVCERLRAAGVKTESLRCADYAISPGVQADMGERVASTTAAAARNTAHLANVLREQRYPSYQ